MSKHKFAPVDKMSVEIGLAKWNFLINGKCEEGQQADICETLSNVSVYP